MHEWPAGRIRVYEICGFVCAAWAHRRKLFVMVVSPLIALMKDQVNSLKGKGLSAVYVSGKSNERLVEELVAEARILSFGHRVLTRPRGATEPCPRGATEPSRSGHYVALPNLLEVYCFVYILCACLQLSVLPCRVLSLFIDRSLLC